MTWLLDTNIVSELTKPAPDTTCVSWLEKRAADCSISTITLAELRWGIERLADGKRKADREKDYRFLIEDYQGRFFEFNAAAATEWGRYAAELEAHYGTDWWKHFDFRDTMIAAIAREYGLIVATRNVKHFPFCRVDNPFAG
ncbi:MAG TPA: PIN domain-containing protein [Verrucomicrobiota bacterium]|nr:PIN domain-containing protein [Verrucomicrobiota bacterium]